MYAITGVTGRPNVKRIPNCRVQRLAPGEIAFENFPFQLNKRYPLFW
jgi:hypothetical protein